METLSHQVDPERYRASIARLTQVFEGISETIGRVSTWRCPYKNGQDRCTAGFGCRNQDRSENVDKLPTCTGSDHLDYRGAWQV